jgi:glyceraldehyde 3-phosphate dehydrogenase
MGAGTRRLPMMRTASRIDGTRLPFIGTRDLSALPLDGVDVVIDCTGVFKTEAALAPYFAAG